MILCNILILLYDIGTYDVINATAYPNGNSICVECVFSSAPSAKSCYVSVIGVTSMNKTFVKNSPRDLTVQDCIDNLPAGNYTVYVYDVENDIPLTSILPAIILRDIVITDILPTISTPICKYLYCNDNLFIFYERVLYFYWCDWNYFVSNSNITVCCNVYMYEETIK